MSQPCHRLKNFISNETHSGDLVPVNGPRIGWQPKWDEKQYLESLDQEIQDVLDLDVLQPSTFNTLISSS